MVEVVPFKAEHIVWLKDRGMVSWAPKGVSVESLQHLERSFFSLSVVEKDSVIACGGVIEQWPGRGISWAFLNTKMGTKMVRCHRLVKRYFDICPLRRVEATVEVGFEAGHRWVRLLGFELETPIMKAFGPKGEDHSMYVRLLKETI